MFAPDREGFCPGLWVQFVEDLSQQEFSSLTTREERLTWIYGRRLVAERMELMMRSGSVKDAQQSLARRETGNQYFLGGETPHRHGQLQPRRGPGRGLLSEPCCRLR